MPDAAQYTFGLFDSSALGWTVPTPAAAPMATGETENDDEPSPHQPRLTPVERKGDEFYALDRRAPARARLARRAPATTWPPSCLSKALEDAGQGAYASPSRSRLLRFIGFGATELAQNAFPLPGETGLPRRLEGDRRGAWRRPRPRPEYAALQRSTPIRALHAGTRRSGRSGARRSVSASAPAACSSRAWAPGCSSP